MFRIFKIKSFDRWFRKTDLTDDALRIAVLEMAAGLIDADLGAGVLNLETSVDRLLRCVTWWF